jgi:hypothetical protein
MTVPTECGTSEPASALRAQSARHQSTETRLANGFELSGAGSFLHLVLPLLPASALLSG